MDINDRLLFGQFLLEKGKIDKTILAKSLKIQKEEKISETPRMLGSILFNDFSVFKNRIELKKYLKEFEKYKDSMREIYLEAKKYGVDPLDKLNQEYADLMDELENADTLKIREAIAKIEKFKIELKNNHNYKDDIIRLENRVCELEEKNTDLLNKLRESIIKSNELLKNYNKLKTYFIKYREKYEKYK
jgi:hypothetical protein